MRLLRVTSQRPQRVQPPVLYRLFGDKNGLLDAVAAYGFTAYLAKKQPPDAKGDPVEALRAGWDLHVEFGLANPELYLLMYADPRPETGSPAAQKAFDLLNLHMQSVAAAGAASSKCSKSLCPLPRSSNWNRDASPIASAEAARPWTISHCT